MLLYVISLCYLDYYTKNINLQQERLFYSSFLNENFNYRRYFYLNRGNFCNVLCFLMNIVSFLALKLELFWTYEGDYENWSSNNFERAGNNLLDIVGSLWSLQENKRTKLRNFMIRKNSQFTLQVLGAESGFCNW